MTEAQNDQLQQELAFYHEHGQIHPSEMFQTEAESIRQLLADGWIGRAEYNTRMADLRWKAAVK